MDTLITRLPAFLFCNLFKQKPGAKPQRRKIQPDQPVNVSTAPRIIPGTHPSAPQKGTGKILRHKNQHHVKKSMADCQIKGFFLEFRPRPQPAVNESADRPQKGSAAVNGKHQKRGLPHQPPVVAQNGINRSKNHFQTPAGHAAFKKIKGQSF